jgi:hypothetical protein
LLFMELRSRCKRYAVASVKAGPVGPPHSDLTSEKATLAKLIAAHEA